jgi:hypothetical protein
VVRGTFSPARAWRPAVVTRLARTLGRTERKFQTACCLVNSCSPAAAQETRRVRNTGANCRKRGQMHSVICEHRQFNQRNFEELSNGASRRALRRIVSQLGRPMAANSKAAAVRRLTSSSDEKYIQPLSIIATSVAASSTHMCRAARRSSALPFSQRLAFSCRFSVAVELSRGKISRCGLTIRSSGEPTACHQARSTSVAYPTFRGPAGTLSPPA